MDKETILNWARLVEESQGDDDLRDDIIMRMRSDSEVDYQNLRQAEDRAKKVIEKFDGSGWTSGTGILYLLMFIQDYVNNGLDSAIDMEKRYFKIVGDKENLGDEIADFLKKFDLYVKGEGRNPSYGKDEVYESEKKG